jgi:hypothetical protein
MVGGFIAEVGDKVELPGGEARMHNFDSADWLMPPSHCTKFDIWWRASGMSISP